MKCGTSSLARWLGDHPQVYMAPEKELRFFDYGWDRGLDWYAARFHAASGFRLVGEATPTYLYEADAHARMARTVPDARLIVMMRDPVDRAYSHYWHWRVQKGERRSFEEAVADELRAPPGSLSGRWDPDRPERYGYLSFGCYAEQLERLATWFQREQIKPVLTEDLVTRPVEIFVEVCRFIGAEPGEVPASVGSVENSYRYYYPAWLWSLMVRVRIGCWLPGRVGAAIWRAMVREGDQYPPMAADLRERLAEHFAAPNHELAALRGRDLCHWGAAHR